MYPDSKGLKLDVQVFDNPKPTMPVIFGTTDEGKVSGKDLLIGAGGWSECAVLFFLHALRGEKNLTTKGMKDTKDISSKKMMIELNMRIEEVNDWICFDPGLRLRKNFTNCGLGKKCQKEKHDLVAGEKIREPIFTCDSEPDHLKITIILDWNP